MTDTQVVHAVVVPDKDAAPEDPSAAVLAVIGPLRRFVCSLVKDTGVADDIVQETLARLLTRQPKLDDSALVGYALVVAKNLVHTEGRRQDRERRHRHLLHDSQPLDTPHDVVVRAEDQDAIREALGKLPAGHRDELVDHVVAGAPLTALARDGNSAALATRLARTRARLRVDYLLSVRRVDLPTDRCRPVLLSLSSGDQRRQRVLRSGNHLVACEQCADLAPPLLQRDRALVGIIPMLPLGQRLLERFTQLARHGPTQLVAGATAAAGGTLIAVMSIGGPAPTPPPADLHSCRLPAVWDHLVATSMGPPGGVSEHLGPRFRCQRCRTGWAGLAAGMRVLR